MRSVFPLLAPLLLQLSVGCCGEAAALYTPTRDLPPLPHVVGLAHPTPHFCIRWRKSLGLCLPRRNHRLPPKSWVWYPEILSPFVNKISFHHSETPPTSQASPGLRAAPCRGCKVRLSEKVKLSTGPSPWAIPRRRGGTTALVRRNVPRRRDPGPSPFTKRSHPGSSLRQADHLSSPHLSLSILPGGPLSLSLSFLIRRMGMQWVTRRSAEISHP